MTRRRRLAAGACLLALFGAGAASQAAAQTQRSQLWDPRDARRAQAAGAELARQALPAEGPGPAVPARAPPPAPARQLDPNAPVTFTAGSVAYDEATQTVTASGRVEAWQNDRVLQADRITFDRRTGMARASGNVVLLEPDGQVLFAETAELNQDFSAGIATGMQGLLAENGRLAATAARRRDGRVTELFRGVYTTCDPCADNPSRAPLWQIRANRAQHDQLQKRVEYWDATLQMAGVPVGWLPYLYHADPSVDRASGLLPPLFGQSRFLGGFFGLPYYWVIDGQSDLTIEPVVTTKQNGFIASEYRRRFNSGYVTFRGSGAYDADQDWRGHVLGAGRFTVNDSWRAGFNVARASDISYMRNYRFGSPRFLTTRPFVESFGAGRYFLADAMSYQGLRITDSDRRSPQVLPRLFYDYQGPADAWGGRFSFDFGTYNIFRLEGTDSRRIGGRAGWSTELADGLGARWRFGGRLDLYGYNYADDAARARDSGNVGIAHPQAFAMWRLPLFRHYGGTTHLVEPIVQLVTSPNVSRGRFPNEDSRDLEFTDANLFALNRFPGRDRLEGGTRVNYGLRNTLFLENGGSLEAMLGQSWRTTRDDTYDPQSGLSGRASDVVARLSADPLPWFGVSYRARYASDQLRQTFSDVSVTVGQRPFAVSGSYVLVPPSVSGNRATRREEVGGAALVGPFQGTRIENWRGLASTYFDLEQNRLVSTAFGLIYEDECFVFDVRYVRSFTNPVLQAEGGTALLFQLTFKTVGDFGFSAF